MSTTDPHDLIRRSRHYLGQAALNMLIYPEDLGKIDRNIERAVEFAMQFRRTFDNTVMPEEWKRLTDEGRQIKAQRAQIDSYVAPATPAPADNSQPAAQTVQTSAPAATTSHLNLDALTKPAESDDGDDFDDEDDDDDQPPGDINAGLAWEPTSDNLGSIAQHGNTVYTVHTTGNPRSWAWGIGDGLQTDWQDERFPSEDLARNAATLHLTQFSQEPIS